MQRRIRRRREHVIDRRTDRSFAAVARRQRVRRQGFRGAIGLAEVADLLRMWLQVQQANQIVGGDHGIPWSAVARHRFGCWTMSLQSQDPKSKAVSCHRTPNRYVRASKMK